MSIPFNLRASIRSLVRPYNMLLNFVLQTQIASPTWPGFQRLAQALRRPIITARLFHPAR